MKSLALALSLLLSSSAFPQTTQSTCGGASTVDIATGHPWATSGDLVDQIDKKDHVMAKAVRGAQEFVERHPKLCADSLPIEIKVATRFGDATGTFDPIKETSTMRIPTGKVTFKMVTLSVKDDFWTLGKNGVTESTGTFKESD